MPFSEHNPQEHKSGSGIYITVAVIALIIVGVVSYLLFFQIVPPKQIVSYEQTEPVEPAPPVERYEPEPVVTQQAPVAEETPLPPQAPAPVTKTAKQSAPIVYIPYTVKQGDMLTSISKKRYGTRFYWPLIYTKNKKALKDQDALKPGMKLMIPDRVDPGSDENLAQLTESFIYAYKNYKRGGKHHKARWLLYACQTQVNTKLIKQYKGRIDPTDLKIIKSYLKRFPDPEAER